MKLKKKISYILQRLKLNKKEIIFVSLISIFCCALDLITKKLIFDNIKQNIVYITPIFNFVKATNYGISFGMFNDRTLAMKVFIIIFDIFVIIYLLTLVKTKNTYKKPKLFITSLSLVVGGAFGNMIDRIICGYVRDFLDFHISNLHWPAFNIADSCICIGVALWIICEIFLKKNDK